MLLSVGAFLLGVALAALALAAIPAVLVHSQATCLPFGEQML